LWRAVFCLDRVARRLARERFGRHTGRAPAVRTDPGRSFSWREGGFDAAAGLTERLAASPAPPVAPEMPPGPAGHGAAEPASRLSAAAADAGRGLAVYFAAASMFWRLAAILSISAVNSCRRSI
jgi:hypothetical protein